VLTRSASRCASLAAIGLKPFVGDVTGALRLPDIELDSVLFAVGFDRSSGDSIREVYVRGLGNVLDTLASAPRRLLYISSTGVYGQTDGSWVDEQSPCRPQREGGRACLEAEEQLAVHRFGRCAVVLRLAGIYGPNRIPKLKTLAAGEELASSADGYLNLIHVEDAVDVVLAAESSAPLPSRYTVSDGHPVRRVDFYRALARLTGAPPPRFISPAAGSSAAERGSTHKRISNRRMIEQLRVSIKYSSYLEGLRAILGA